jgi:hypothetical protein
MDGEAIARDVLGQDASSQTLTAIQTGIEGKNAATSLVAALILSSPDFERR